MRSMVSGFQELAYCHRGANAPWLSTPKTSGIEPTQWYIQIQFINYVSKSQKKKKIKGKRYTQLGVFPCFHFYDKHKNIGMVG